jgi:S-adenosylmethionine:tRNA ribosyltransferase-isomerase
VIDNTTSRGRTLRFLYDGSYEEFRNKLTELGETPIPKYISRDVTQKMQSVTKLFMQRKKVL